MTSIYDEMNLQTRKKIQDCFMELLSKKEFSKVSIKDITTNASINRGTFYLHYVDKYELLDQIENQLLEGLKVHLEAMNMKDAMVKEKHMEIAVLSTEVFRYFNQHAEQFMILLSKNNTSGFHFRLKNFFIKQFEVNYYRSELFKIDPSIPIDYISAFAASAILGLIEQWLSHEKRETPEEIAKLYMKILLFIKTV
ncbi:TetR/AcrR family transcriptional regulator [Rummeliibacillus pycnus]|uniref:TetR/AcrR family transcriptional regulator n=1 Tax=Rummeliibacillus pycnus TaxID=101070 RepID=UPI001475667B|nr:TetR/AcrR family transcriptional regulator [Rummeliibacillus pycnus]